MLEDFLVTVGVGWLGLTWLERKNQRDLDALQRGYVEGPAADEAHQNVTPSPSLWQRWQARRQARVVRAAERRAERAAAADLVARQRVWQEGFERHLDTTGR